jgi:hypothetical protein
MGCLLQEASGSWLKGAKYERSDEVFRPLTKHTYVATDTSWLAGLDSEYQRRHYDDKSEALPPPYPE